jgi:predicted CopG family antitoxin
MNQETTVKISKRTLEELKKMKAETGSATMDDVMLVLIAERRGSLLSSAFGAAGKS